MRELTYAINNKHMHGILRYAELVKLPAWLREPASSWNSLRVDDEYPHVDRLWRVLGDLPTPSDVAEGVATYRVYLHKIYPTPPNTASLWHRHRWPSAVRVWCPPDPSTGLAGHYIHERGFSPDVMDDSVAVKALSHSETYAMTRPSEYHAVDVLISPTYSVMVVGPLYDHEGKPQERTLRHKLGPVDTETAESMLAQFRTLYQLPRRTGS